MHPSHFYLLHALLLAFQPQTLASPITNGGIDLVKSSPTSGEVVALSLGILGFFIIITLSWKTPSQATAHRGGRLHRLRLGLSRGQAPDAPSSRTPEPEGIRVPDAVMRPASVASPLDIALPRPCSSDQGGQTGGHEARMQE
ncbi:hypothetical protein EVG20_g1745 [Dentipellis fragilis]|uniref:Uncharacterized protein n=1 Tax=Dentipellis fragilis TaxID=205917 RepID=A0A4Y9Z908_9AGAM|nr:hypothetical protein EVG20_g1745 [Dentipellis fragilis]